MKYKPNPLWRVWQRYVNRQRRRCGWERVDTGELPDLHPLARITKWLGRLPQAEDERWT